MKKFKKIGVTLILILAFPLLAACGARIDVVEWQDADNFYNELQIVLSDAILSEINRSATSNGIEKWTLTSYLSELLAQYSDYELARTQKENGETKIVFYSSVSKDESSGGGGGKEPETIKEENLFVRSVEIIMDNPLNGLIDSFKKAQGNKLDYYSVFGVILRGQRINTIDGYRETYPSIFAAFPYLADKDYENMLMSFIWQAPKNWKSSGETIHIDGEKYFRWSRDLSEDGAKISYKYYRANSVGWNIVAIAAGGLTVLIIFLVFFIKGKKKPPKETTKDLFPYDPFAT